MALPLPFDLKNKTKSFIDVVVDSIATGIAGFLLIFVVKGLDLPSYYIAAIVIVLVGVWVSFIFKVRKEYYKTFRKNLEVLTDYSEKSPKPMGKKVSVVKGMRNVFQSGTEEQILFMLGKLMEINDKRFEKDVEQLLEHPSTKIRTAAIQNLYFLNTATMISNVNPLLYSDDEDLTVATLEYLLLHAEKDRSLVYDRYLDSENRRISNAALYCLAKESRNNEILKDTYALHNRISDQIKRIPVENGEKDSLKFLLKTIGAANSQSHFPIISKYLNDTRPEIAGAAIIAASLGKDNCFIIPLIEFLPQKKFRKLATDALIGYGRTMVPLLTNITIERLVSLETCRLIPGVLQNFALQETVRSLFMLMEDSDLTIRLESIRALSEIRKQHPKLTFNKYRIVALIYEECKLHHSTLSAMHTQIIISYRNRTKAKREISDEERDARTSLLEILERRLDAGLERIFKLLGLRYPQKDIEIAYEGLVSQKQEARTNAIEFLDNLLTGELKRALLPIIEESALDIASDEVLQKIKHKVPSEMECFRLLLGGNDLKLKLAVLYLIKHQKDEKYVPLIMKYIQSDNLKLRTFAQDAWEGILMGR